jgi:hypothetical protein
MARMQGGYEYDPNENKYVSEGARKASTNNLQQSNDYSGQNTGNGTYLQPYANDQSTVPNTVGANSDQYGTWGSQMDTRLVSPYEQLISKYQSLKRPGTGYKWTNLQAQTLDPQYTSFRDKMYGTVANLMSQPTGYSDAERQAIQGSSLDKIYGGQAGAAETLRRQAARNGLLGSGLIMGQQQQQGLQNQQQVASTMRDLANQELQNKREAAYQAAGLGQSWANQMGGEAYQQQQYLDAIAKANQQGQLAADRSAGAGQNQYNSGLMSLYQQLANAQVNQAKYDDAMTQYALGQGDQAAQDEYTRYVNEYNSNPYEGMDNPYI